MLGEENNSSKEQSQAIEIDTNYLRILKLEGRKEGNDTKYKIFIKFNQNQPSASKYVAKSFANVATAEKKETAGNPLCEWESEAKAF